MAGERRRYRCGWCGTNNHDACRSVIQMSTGLWRCPCGCPQSQQSYCVDCNRRGVEVTQTTSRCVDQADCQGYRDRKARDRASESFLQKYRERIAIPSAKDAETPKESRPRNVGQCVCCGEPTRGGKFLPGHDARYISQTALTYLNADESTQQKIADVIVTLSPALQAKFEKRVGSMREAAAKQQAVVV